MKRKVNESGNIAHRRRRMVCGDEPSNKNISLEAETEGDPGVT